MANSVVNRSPITAIELTVTVQVLSVSISLRPPILAKIQKPESFIQLPHWAPKPMAAAR